MGWFGGESHEANAYDEYQNIPEGEEHKAKFSHELLSGAAAFEAARAYEKHCAENGQPASHQEAKELLAGFAGAFIDREVETRGLDTLDREKAKREARRRLEDQVQNDY